jgi:hypothetical protein
MNHGYLLMLAVVLLLCPTCKTRTTVSSPVIRMDLRHDLPQKARRRLAALDTTYACSRRVRLVQGPASQQFIVTWRVFEFKQSRHVTAVQVEPHGETQGASAPSAAAVVGEVSMTKNGIFVLPIQIRWTASEGCSTVSAQKSIELRGDDPGCKPPKPKILKLLGP